MRSVKAGALVLLMIISLTIPVMTSSLQEQNTSSGVSFSQTSPGVVSDFLSLNSTGASAIQAIDHHSSGAWAACAYFNGTVNPVDTLNSQVQQRESDGGEDVLLFGGSTMMNITWVTHIRSSQDVNCRGLEIIDHQRVVTFGTFQSSVQIGTSTKYGEGQKDGFLGVYNFTGQYWEDSATFGGSGNDEIRDVVPVSSDFIAVGYSSSDLTTDYSSILPTSAGDCSSTQCGFVVEFSSDLVAQDANVVTSDEGGVKLYQITDQNAQGTSVIVGEFKGNLTLTGSTITGIQSSGAQDGIVIELDNALDFTGVNRIGGVNFDAAEAIQRISTGGYLVAMEVTGTYNTTRPLNGVYSSSAGDRDIAVFQLYNNLSVNHHYSFGTSGPDQLRDLSLLQSGAVFSLTGHIDGLMTFAGASIGIAQGTDTAFFASLELNSTGIQPLWAYSATGSSSGDGQGVSISHVSDGLLYWSGRSTPSGPTGTQFGTTQLVGGDQYAGYLALMDVDEDLDGVGSRYDNCPTTANSQQEDFDDDGEGDACDDDDDNDGVLDLNDNCPRDLLFWPSVPSEDHDQDGCRDSGSENQGQGQDTDDDNDGRDDADDDCPKGALNWDSTDVQLDHDSDGCQDDDVEDNDDDNDGILDDVDACPRGGLLSGDDWDYDGCKDAADDDIDGDHRRNNEDRCNYTAMNLGFDSRDRNSDWDGDGCEDATEDLDDDDDGLIDGNEHEDCRPPDSVLGTSEYWSDHDADGCDDDNEDSDDDNDGVPDLIDVCPRGQLGWTSDPSSDYDGDGCKDASEDTDDDNDGVDDVDDQCPKASANISDYDGDGCTGALDEDWDNDGIDNDEDQCEEGDLGWSAVSGEEDNDRDGCRDSTEDHDDDNDGLSDNIDNCPTGTVGWDSNDSSIDYDGDGCLDSTEDTDTDGDGLNNSEELCDYSPRDGFPDHDGDGCDDLTEDSDDDNDGFDDDVDECATSPMARENLENFDLDGCFGSEDTDSDNDGIPNSEDQCNPADGFVTGIGWLSGSTTDHDRDGCEDRSEDTDDDNDKKPDELDTCEKGMINWDSTNTNLDFDQDGCHNEEDPDIDSDFVLNEQDKFPYDCRYSGDMDNDGKPDPSVTTNCVFVGLSNLIVDEDTDGDGVSDAHEEKCATRVLDFNDKPPEGYRTEGGDCGPKISKWFEKFDEDPRFYTILAVVFVLIVLFGFVVVYKAGTMQVFNNSPNAHGELITGTKRGDKIGKGGIKAGETVNTGTKVGGHLAQDKARQINDDNSRNQTSNSVPPILPPPPVTPVPEPGFVPSSIDPNHLLDTLSEEPASNKVGTNSTSSTVAKQPNGVDSQNQAESQTSISPPLPSGGLPDGWTLEQWEHYGQDWLDKFGMEE